MADMYGCYSCGTINGTFEEHLDGTVTCGTCGEDTVITFEQALGILLYLSEIGVFEKASIEEIELFHE